MSDNLQIILGGAVLGLLMIVLTLVMVLQFGDDGTVLVSNDSGTLSIVAVVFIGLAYLIADTLKTRNFTDGYGRLIDKLTQDAILTDAIEANYLAMPEGLQKNAVDLLADIAKHLVELTPTDADDKLGGWLDDVRDGEPRKT